MEFFTTPNSKNISATIRIVTVEKSEITFLLMLYFHAHGHDKMIIRTLELSCPSIYGPLKITFQSCLEQ